MFQIRLKELREDQKMSQKELSEKLGMSQSAIGMWESGKREPNFATMKILAKFFGVSVDYLVGNVNEPYFDLDNKRILAEINGLDGYDGAENGFQINSDFSQLKGAYLSLAKEAQESKIEPDDIRKALQIIRDIRAQERNREK